MDHRSLSRQAKEQYTDRIRDRRGESPSDAAADKARIVKAFDEHDSQLHGGRKTKLALKDGGCAEGSPAAARLDRPGRARGGKMPKKAHTNVNVIVASGGKEKEPVPVPVPMGGPPRPPMPPPGAMGPPPGGPPGGPPGMGGPPPGAGMPPPGVGGPRPPMMPMRADGGKTVAVKMDAGAASGEGRMDKAKMKIADANADD